MDADRVSRADLARLRAGVAVIRRAAWMLLTAVLVVWSLGLNVNNLDRSDFPAALWRDKEDVPAHEVARWARVRWALPRRGVIGYVDDEATSSGQSLAWYALAPLRLDVRAEAKHAIIAVNLHGDEALTRWARVEGGRVLARSGDGLGVVARDGATQP